MEATVPADDPLSVPLAALDPRPQRPKWQSAGRALAGLCAVATVLCLAPLALRAALPVLPLLTLVVAAWLGWLALARPWRLLHGLRILRGIPRDVGFVLRLVKATRQLNQRLHRSHGTFTTADYWAETLEMHGDKEALIFGSTVFSYRDIDRESNRVAHWAISEGVGRGSRGVALCCANRPEHLFIWLGVAKVGGAVSLINGSLRGSSLEHALTQCSVSLVLFDETAIESLGALAAGGAKYRFLSIDPGPPPDFAETLILPSGAVEPPPVELRAKCCATDTLLHIFTSGTTGLPKAARLNHVRFFSAIVIAYMFDLRSSDRFHCCLPMCHTAAIGGFSLCWWLGMPMVLAPRFSASNFWKDCVEHRVTVVQYVGELCRYLVHSPVSQYDRAHTVRLAFGNGLRPEVWPRFTARFGVPRIAEVYASTEGNANLGKQGAIGFISPLLAKMYPVKLAKLRNDGSYELQRSADGLCVLCSAGEAGELLGLVNQRDASRNFAGYTDAAATRRKLVRDVVRRGDCWFRTGDLMRADEDGFVYFVDRLGDTYRYKGENVSTAEVAAVIGGLPELRVQHCLVYGLQLPNVDGRVGMAALLTEPEAPILSMEALFTGLESHLPPFAHPRFVRLLDSPEAIDSTITFKPKKEKLQLQGIEGGRVFVRDAAARTFVEMDREMCSKILNGERSLE